MELYLTNKPRYHYVLGLQNFFCCITSKEGSVRAILGHPVEPFISKIRRPINYYPNQNI
jgi:hypothetical protein